MNGWLSESGTIAFEQLYADVSAGKYTPPWYHGIEHLRKDHQGYVYWKGVQVEHYSFKKYEEAHTAALGLAERCRTLERLGIDVSLRNVIWQYEELVGTGVTE